MKRISVCLLAFALLAGGFVYWWLTSPPAPADDLSDAGHVTPVKPSPGETTPTEPRLGEPRVESEEEKDRRRLLGVWYDDHLKEQIMTMTVNKDGTGTMLIELSGWEAAIFAAKLRFDMQWSLVGKKMLTKMVGGEPAGKVNFILNTRDTSGDNTILELTDDQLLLLDKNGKTKYEWRRSKKD
jgi:hypothetical protein